MTSLGYFFIFVEEGIAKLKSLYSCEIVSVLGGLLCVPRLTVLSLLFPCEFSVD